MEAVSYISDGVTYKVEPILDDSFIAGDMLTVADAVQDTDPDEYKSAMEKSVEQELAFSVYVEDTRVGFVYCYKEDFKYIGASLYIHHNLISVLVALRTIFEMSDSHKLVFTPHEDGLQYFKSMCTGPSIRAYHAVGSPVTVLRSSIYAKGERLFSYLGITNG